MKQLRTELKCDSKTKKKGSISKVPVFSLFYSSDFMKNLPRLMNPGDMIVTTSSISFTF